MVRDLRASQKVPIGAIDDAGAERRSARGWTRRRSRASGGEEASGSARSLPHQRNARRCGSSASNGADGGDRKTGDAAWAEPWNASDRLAWKPVPASAIGTMGTGSGRASTASVWAHRASR